MNVSPASLPNFASTNSAESAPDYSLPGAIEVTREDLMRSLNPLQHVPVVGMIYREATGQAIPAPMRVAGAALLGGPLGMIGAGFMCLVEALLKMGPDTSRPPVPVGMSQTGAESGVEPVTPGSATGGGYLTLATTTPDFLQPTPATVPNTALVQNGAAAYGDAMLEWERSQMVEKGLA